MKKLFMVVIMLVVTISVFADVTEIATALIARNEGFKSNTYCDNCRKTLTKGNTKCCGKATIGYGFTSKKLVEAGYISKVDADKVLAGYVDNCLKVVDGIEYKVQLTDNQKAVLADMVFHFGGSAIVNADDLNTAINSGDASKVKTQLMRWNKVTTKRDSTGKSIEWKIVPGLTNRQSRLCQIWDK